MTLCKIDLAMTQKMSPTFSTCNSFNPFCISSCIRRSSVSLLCSRNASLALRFAYSLKLYAANCRACRSNERNSERASNAVGVAMSRKSCGSSRRSEGWCERWRNARRCLAVVEGLCHLKIGVCSRCRRRRLGGPIGLRYTTKGYSPFLCVYEARKAAITCIIHRIVCHCLSRSLTKI